MDAAGPRWHCLGGGPCGAGRGVVAAPRPAGCVGEGPAACRQPEPRLGETPNDPGLALAPPRRSRVWVCTSFGVVFEVFPTVEPCLCALGGVTWSCLRRPGGFPSPWCRFALGDF